MSLCTKDKDVNISLDTPDASLSATTGMMPCAAENAMSASADTSDLANAYQDANISYDLKQGITDEVTPTLIIFLKHYFSLTKIPAYFYHAITTPTSIHNSEHIALLKRQRDQRRTPIYPL